MSDYWYRALILCKETGSCNCFATANQPNEEKEEDTNHQVVVSDTMQLVQDKQEVTEIMAVTAKVMPKYPEIDTNKQFSFLNSMLPHSMEE